MIHVALDVGGMRKNWDERHDEGFLLSTDCKLCVKVAVFLSEGWQWERERQGSCIYQKEALVN